jgi:hypothetical protein
MVPGPAKTWRYATLRPSGDVAWGDKATLTQTPGGDPVGVKYLSETGDVLGTATAYLIATDHLPGGTLMVPEGPSERVELDESPAHLAANLAAKLAH